MAEAPGCATPSLASLAKRLPEGCTLTADAGPAGMQLSTCQRETLKLVSFPMHVCEKSPTRMPVMVWGHDCSWRMLWNISSRVYVSTCQHEALTYMSLPVLMLEKMFTMMPFTSWSLAPGWKGIAQYETLEDSCSVFHSPWLAPLGDLRIPGHPSWMASSLDASLGIASSWRLVLHPAGLLHPDGDLRPGGLLLRWMAAWLTASSMDCALADCFPVGLHPGGSHPGGLLPHWTELVPNPRWVASGWIASWGP